MLVLETHTQAESNALHLARVTDNTHHKSKSIVRKAILIHSRSDSLYSAVLTWNGLHMTNPLSGEDIATTKMIQFWLLQFDCQPPVLSSLKSFTSKPKSHNLRLDYEHRSLSNAYWGLNLGATLSSISNGPHAGHPRSRWWLTMSPLSRFLPFLISLSLSLPIWHIAVILFERRDSVNWHVATSFIVKFPNLLALLTQSCP